MTCVLEILSIPDLIKRKINLLKQLKKVEEELLIRNTEISNDLDSTTSNDFNNNQELLLNNNLDIFIDQNLTNNNIKKIKINVKKK
jgi:hypothetical protein